MPVRGIDLFCGAGGSSLGARMAGVEVLAGIDAWPVAIQTYGRNFPRSQAILARIRSGRVIRDLDQVGSVEIVFASPECTNHTCARGSRPRDDASRRTAYRILDFISRFQPRWVVLENVVGIKKWRGYARLLSRLSTEYHVREEILDAADFGVPQQRRRLFLLCDRERVPSPVSLPRMQRRRVAADAIQSDGPWKSLPLYSSRRANETIERAERAIGKLGRHVPFLIVYYGSDGAGGWQSLDRPLRTLTTLDRFGLVTWEGPNPMLRMLQVPELATAMGFPPGFDLTAGSRRDRIKMLGNAVCPPVMAAIVSALTKDASTALRRSPQIYGVEPTLRPA